jgi:16S rRNA (cytosine1402-N4)-methyltransferase
VCPPELPICVCRHEPEAELIASGGVTPSRDEVADNPRARAARLRAGRRLRAASEADG